jgi:hypothetical protein
MVCLKAEPERLDQLMRGNGHRMADFVDEDLDDMRTAIAVGPLERDTAERLFGDLCLA